jgi:hypothetical protein
VTSETPPEPGQVRVIARCDGTETDITEGVQALYDLVIGSMDWGSGFWTAEDAAPVAALARACGFERAEEAERYLRQQQHSAEQLRFRQTHPEEVKRWVRGERAHDHVFSSAGKCMWPACEAIEDGTS